MTKRLIFVDSAFHIITTISNYYLSFLFPPFPRYNLPPFHTHTHQQAIEIPSVLVGLKDGGRLLAASECHSSLLRLNFTCQTLYEAAHGSAHDLEPGRSGPFRAGRDEGVVLG